jgi:glycosyltransferase involved in cell wall biosynthesis
VTRRRNGGGVTVGWASAGTLAAPRPTFRGLPANVAMRIANIAHWIDRNADDVHNEMYRPDRRYDVVVFVKAMDAAAQDAARRVRRDGGRVVFDANVNYYEIWGDYDLPATRPTERQREDAIAMTRLADWVVADSSYLLEIVRRLNPSATFLPDNVDTDRFRPRRRARAAKTLRVIWSGMAHKAAPLLTIREPLAALHGAQLVVVSNERPPEMEALGRAIPVRFVRFSLRRYARLLRRCDVIVSPKRLVNGYELGHSEWKITLGMAAALPAIATPQQSYVEAIADRGGGLLAESTDEWREALARLTSDAPLRAELGARARRTVVERYSTPVVAAQYLALLRGLVR